MTKDALGDRIKDQYEDRTRIALPRRTYTIIRVDGKAFHTFTAGMKRPFDRELMNIMDETAKFMCENIQGVHVAYTQSDEISLLLTDFAKTTSDAWFDGNLQKMASVAASMATCAFNSSRIHAIAEKSLSGDKESKIDLAALHANCLRMAMFDARVFTIPDPTEVENYFIWRQNDASRNSIQMAARAVYSHKELNGKGTPELHDMLMAKGINWNDYTSGEKRGRCIVRETYEVMSVNNNPKHHQAGPAIRHRWTALDGKVNGETPIFTQSRDFLRGLIPRISEVNFGLNP